MGAIKMGRSKYSLIMVFIVGMAIGQLLPEPTDALYFYYNNWLYANQGNLSSMDFIIYQMLLYYILPMVWYVIMFVFLAATNIEPQDEMMYLIGLISFGGVLGVVISLSVQSMSFLWVLISVIVVIVSSLASMVLLNYYGNKRHR
jgi:hypothetical protein